MFWRKTKGPNLAAHSFRSGGNALADQLLAAAHIDFDKATNLQQALVGTFLFGMLTAEGMSRGLNATEVRDGALQVFRDTLHYTSLAAEEGVENCIEATGPNGHNAMKAIIHRGIDGHRQVVGGDAAALAQNIGDVLRRFNGSFS